MEHVLNVAIVGLGHGTQGLDALHHADGRIGNGGGDFMNPGLLLGHIGQDQVGKRAANVYADEFHARSPHIPMLSRILGRDGVGKMFRLHVWGDR